MNEYGDLPSGWTLAPFPDVATINPTNPANVPVDDTPVSFVPMAAVEELSGRMNASTTRSWSDVKKGFTRFQDGDVVFAKITPSMENGKVALAANLLNGVAAGTTEFHVFRPKSGVAGRYLLHFLLQETFRRRARARMTATAGQLRVPTQFLEEEVLPLAPAPEQQRLVEAIDSYLTRLDDAAASLERVQIKLKAYRASVLKAAVEGRLVPTEASLERVETRAYEPAEALIGRILKERRIRWEEAELTKLKAASKTPKDNRWRANYQEPVTPDTTTLPELPEGWCWTTVEILSSDKQGSICAGPFGTIFKAKDFRDTGIPIIFLRHVKPDRFLRRRPTFMDEVKWKELFRNYSVYGGELLVTKLGDPPGDCAVFPPAAAPSMLTPDVMKLELDLHLAVPRYIMHYINSTVARRYAFGAAFGTTRLRLTLPLFRAMPVPLPPLAEQERIVEQIDRLLTVVDETDASVERDRRRCDRLRQAILKWAFEGKLTDQDPADESADKLLARIRTECVVSAPTKKNCDRTGTRVV